MSYRETILKNQENNCAEKWWPKFAFHYTDLFNAVNILSEGILYSRANANDLGLMKNDNASHQVIDVTDARTKSLVRLYFRPLTPTQYHNEGYKPLEIRYQDDAEANVPVPVFFLFDLEKILNLPTTRFSKYSLAGKNFELLSTPEEFEKLDFKEIYKTGPMINSETEKKQRMAEIVILDSLPLSGLLKYIVCRNDIERLTLLNTLYLKNIKLYDIYKNIIGVNKNIFENNGLFIENCNYFDGQIAITYSNTNAKNEYIAHYHNIQSEKLFVNASLEIYWLKQREIVKKDNITYTICYINALPTILSNLNPPSQADRLLAYIRFDNKIMASIVFDLNKFSLL